MKCVVFSDLPNVHHGHHDLVDGPHGSSAQPALHERLPRAAMAEHHRTAIHRQGAVHVPTNALRRISAEALLEGGEPHGGAAAALQVRRRRGGDGGADDPTAAIGRTS